MRGDKERDEVIGVLMFMAAFLFAVFIGNIFWEMMKGASSADISHGTTLEAKNK